MHYSFFRGYTAPEYAIHGQLSEKVDAYSFGVLVLEIISGTKSSETKGEEGEFLLKRVNSPNALLVKSLLFDELLSKALFN